MDTWKKPKQKWRDVKEKKRQRKHVVLLIEKAKEEELKIQIAENEKQEAAEKEAGPIVNPSTISMAVPGSILENAQSAELRTYLAGQIARAACIYNVDEIVIFDDNAAGNLSNTKMSKIGNLYLFHLSKMSYICYFLLETAEGVQTARPCCVQFARILQYLECPQYLRKFFFPIHNDLKFSGLLNPLDSQHHLRLQSAFMYREGIVSDKKHKRGSFVNIGLLNDILVDKQLSPGLRVTVKLDSIAAETKTKKLKGKVVPPSEPRRATGIYWGYNVRIASSISQVFSQSPYADGYDVTVGTSDKGQALNQVGSNSLEYNHLLIVFGGLYGLENALENDSALNIDDPSLLFDHYFNVVSKQGKDLS